MQKYVYSFVIGIVFFILSYFIVDISIVWSILIATLSFFAGRLLFLDNDMKITLQNLDEKSTLEDSYKKIREIRSMLPLIDNKEIVENVDEICKLSKDILNTLKQNPKNLNTFYTFLNYYLPVTESLLKRYEKMENQNLTSKESREVQSRILSLTGDIRVSFSNFLNRMYNHELEDMSAEIDVFESVLRHDGLLEDSLMKGVKK